MSYLISPIKNGGITSPKKFLAGAINCSIKSNNLKKDDLTLIHSLNPTTCSGTFTTNKIKAAPVKVSISHLRGGDIRSIIANSGNANACNGAKGIEDARIMTQKVAKHFQLRRRQILVASTGIIGMPLPIEKIEDKIPTLCEKISDTPGSSLDSAKAIMTSDTRPKQGAYEIKLKGGKKIKIGAIAKGAGMICPNMATMLCFITTDAKIDRRLLQSATTQAVRNTFNRITIDGDTSTNDTVFVMANGAAQNNTIKAGSPLDSAFREALTKIMDDMARKIVSDGEKVTKFVEIEVRGARTISDAQKVAESVAKSTLVKCSWNGSDPNWGRVIHAVGNSDANINEELIDIYFDGIAATHNGMATKTSIQTLEKVTKKKHFTVTIDLNQGSREHTIYTTDYSPEFIRYNAEEYALAVQTKANQNK